MRISSRIEAYVVICGTFETVTALAMHITHIYEIHEDIHLPRPEPILATLDAVFLLLLFLSTRRTEM